MQPRDSFVFVIGPALALSPRMMTVRFWGVRGSIATAGEHTARTGGNTSCVEVRAGNQLLILDAGTGLRALGAALAATGEAVDAKLLLSHFHWDHIQGFPFFGPAYAPSSKLAIYGPERAAARGDVRAAMEAQMRAPHFPVGMEAMRASLSFHGLPSGATVSFGDLRVQAAAACHPNGCLAYRISHGGRSVVYATDTEHDSATGRLDAGLVALARGADVLIYDAQYTDEEYATKRGWGHSTNTEGARLAQAAGVGQLVLFHHDPSHDDREIARIERETQQRFPSTIAAREGLEIALDPLARAAA
jgi:phosphoribosyl 1,2-cyclic phosphodiesterase